MPLIKIAPLLSVPVAMQLIRERSCAAADLCSANEGDYLFFAFAALFVGGVIASGHRWYRDFIKGDFWLDDAKARGLI